MKILYAGARKENYDLRRRGMSFEYQNFYKTLTGMVGVEVIEIPFDEILTSGKKAFREKFFETISREQPDAVFVFMYTDELSLADFDQVCREHRIPVVMWFADDYWRFWNYSRYFAPHATLAVTTSAQTFGWYQKYGIENVMLSQWACNIRDFHPVEVPQDIDVSFVGQYKPPRAAVLEKLQAAGIRAEVFGAGWPAGRLPEKELVAVFSRSRINLNMADRPGAFSPRVLARIILKKSIDRVVPDFRIFRNARAWWHFRLPHIHARPFELAGCGAFVISSYVEGMERYYEPDREMVFYRTFSELEHKIKYYLAHENERARIARQGHERTVRDHTYEKRFLEIFDRIGISYP